MIARTWRGWTRREDAGAYLEYLLQTGIPAYRATPGNIGAYVLRRPDGDLFEFVTLSFWESLDAIERFAGHDVTRAVFYPEDERFLVRKDEHVTHFDVTSGDQAATEGT